MDKLYPDMVQNDSAHHKNICPGWGSKPQTTVTTQGY